ncbi:Gag-Pol polyprotein [Gossypium australe]|uniref:Gag-Pol polyprotein n=1 Tax=Gossypium australe TaxID=47621 RepID=A0A5B6X2Z9_9ROSI|nr:Gag-Pol polyprotein [Gossypium australe]
MTVIEYEHEFVRLSKYARECISTEAIMCKRFKGGLNDDVHLFVGVLELKEFVLLVDRACKAEKLVKEKRRAEIKSRDSRKRQLGKSFQSSSKKSRDSAGFSNGSKGKQSLGSKVQTTSVASVANARPSRPECAQCGRRHLGECQANEEACFRCGSLDHFIRDCPEVDEKEKPQSVRSVGTARGRSQRNLGNEMSSKNISREQAARVDDRASVRTYAIRAREEASSPDVITGTFSLYDTHVIALIDPGSTHSYICMKLASSMNMPGSYFLANLMLLPFEEFDVILGMDWITTHDVIVNCERKFIKLKCESGDLIRVESDEQDRLPVVISSLLTQKYL